jgi:hypothetical protein
MNHTRERRKAQLSYLLKTTSGREKILDTYRRLCLRARHGNTPAVSFEEMAQFILEAEFPAEVGTNRSDQS